MPKKQTELRQLLDIFSRCLPFLSCNQRRFVSFLFRSPQYMEKLESQADSLVKPDFEGFLESSEGFIPDTECSRILSYSYHDGFAVQGQFKKLWGNNLPKIRDSYALVLKNCDIQGVADAYQELTGRSIYEHTRSDAPPSEEDLRRALADVLLSRMQEIGRICQKLGSRPREYVPSLKIQEIVRQQLEGENPFQKEEIVYREFVCCYCENNKERFSVAAYFADEKQNVYAAMWLGDIYYHGLTMKYGAISCFEVKKDRKKALAYYLLAAEKGYIPACWAAADMWVKGDAREELSEQKAMAFLENGLLTNDGVLVDGYPPSLVTRGGLYIAQARGEAADSARRELFRKGVEYYDKAAEKGYLYAFNRLYYVFTKPEYNKLRQLVSDWKLSSAADPQGHPEEFLKHAIDFNNAWAMNRYALDCCVRDEEKKKYFRDAAFFGEPWGAYNFAERYCSHDPADYPDYWKYMSRASRAGLAKASVRLAEFVKNHPDWAQEHPELDFMGPCTVDDFYRLAEQQCEADPNQRSEELNNSLRLWKFGL